MGDINFTAEVGNWIVVKKLKVDSNAPKIEVSRSLASIQQTIGKKMWDFMCDELPIHEYDKIAYGVSGAQYDEKKKDWLIKGKVSEQQMATALVKLSNPSITKQINEVTKNKTKTGVELAKSYITVKVLDLLGVRISVDPKLIEKYVTEKAKLGL